MRGKVYGGQDHSTGYWGIDFWGSWIFVERS
jgi:hypothetical protein